MSGAPPPEGLLDAVDAIDLAQIRGGSSTLGYLRGRTIGVRLSLELEKLPKAPEKPSLGARFRALFGRSNAS